MDTVIPEWEIEKIFKELEGEKDGDDDKCKRCGYPTRIIKLFYSEVRHCDFCDK